MSTNFRNSYILISSVVLIVLLNQLSLSHGKSYIEDLTITEEQKQILDEFKERVHSRLPHEYMKHDSYLIRWLRAKYFNVADAQKMLLDNLRWREENQMDTIHDEDWSEYYRNYPYSLKPRDREGKPVLYAHVGKWDLRKAALAGQGTRFYRYVDKAIDEAVTLTRELGDKYQNVSQAILIIDIEGFNLVQHGCLQCIPLILRIIQTYETHNPGTADKLIIVNSPAIAAPITRVARLTFHPDTNAIYFVYGTNKRVWKEALSKDFTPDQLPPNLGGTLKADDGHGVIDEDENELDNFY